MQHLLGHGNELNLYLECNRKPMTAPKRGVTDSGFSSADGHSGFCAEDGFGGTERTVRRGLP